jgi:uncharacterized protein
MMPRLFESSTVFCLDTAEFRAGVHLLAEDLAASAPDMVIGIARGGVALAVSLATHLCRPVLTVSARHNSDDGIRQHASGTVHVDLTAIRHVDPGLRLLVCDDIYGTGATIHTVSTALVDAVVPRSIRTVTLCRNDGATDFPDLWLWNVRDWVVFPWEQRPSTTAMHPLPHAGHLRRKP